MLSSNNFLKVLLLKFLFLKLVNCKCDSFGNVSMHVVPKTGNSFDATVEGCIERLTFDEGRILVKEVYANKQQIQHIKKDAVKHLWNLRVLSFTECNSETIEEGAFRNVPILSTITLTYGRLKTIPIDVFNNLEELEILELNNNEIESIDDEALAAISTLKTVNVSHNLLQVFNKNWFLNDTALTKVDLSYNKIQKIPKGAFEDLLSLTEIYLNDNALTEIQSKAFHGLRRLSVLNLSNNLLIVLNANSFQTNVRIQKFFIDANHLNFIASDVLSKIKVKQITLEGNPWKCACWDRINFWVYQNNGTVESLDRCRYIDNIPNCIYPETFAETCLDVVDEEATRTFFDRIRSAVSDLEQFKLNSLQKHVKNASDVEYPAYGVTGPNKDTSPSGDRRLAQSAQMYHYQHQKQQIIAMERAAAGERHGSVSEVDSDEENEEGDYTVYECPGLAPTGEMEVKNPLFQDDPTPAQTPAQKSLEGEDKKK